MKFRSFLRHLDLRWFRGMKVRPTRPIQKKAVPLQLETLETRITPSTTPTIIKTLTTPADGSSVSTSTPTIQVVFSEQMNTAEASNPNNYFLFGSAGNSIAINSVTLTGPDASGHETATLNYNGGSPLILDTYTLFVAGDQISSSAANGNLPLAQPGQFVVANGGASNVSIVNMPGNGTLSSAAGYGLPTGSDSATPTPVAAVAGVLTNSGRPDLVVVDAAGSQVDIYAGQPQASGGGFDLTPDLILNLPTGSANKANSVTLGDFNNDGNLDIAVANFGTNNITVFLNTTSAGNLSFDGGTNYAGTGVATLSGPTAIVAGDFDGATANGKPVEDLAVVNNTPSTSDGDNYDLVIFQGNGSGSFGTPVPATSRIALGNSTLGSGLQGLTSLAVGQFARNANNVPDLVAAGPGGAQVLLNQTTGIGNFSFNQPAQDHFSQNISNVAAGVVRATSGSGTQLDDIVALDAVNNQVDIWQNANSSSIGVASFTFMSTDSFGSNLTGLALAPLVSGSSLEDILVTQNNKAGVLSVLLNNSTIGSTTFAAPVSYTVDNNPVAVVAADFSGATDGSGNPLDQVVTVNNTAADVTLLQSAGNGTLNTATNTSLRATTTAVAVGDLNGDGIPDLVIAQNTPASGGFHGSSGSTTITVMLGSLNANGDVTYGADSFSYTAANSGLQIHNAVSIAIGNIYGGPFNDIVLLDQTDSEVEVFKNDLTSSAAPLGAGSFTPENTIGVGNNPTQLVLANLNNATTAGGLPILDLVVAHEGSGGGFHGGGNPGGVSILLGNGNGTFGRDTEYDANNTAVAVAVADFNNDGNLDFVVANTNNNGTIAVYYGNGNGTFSDPAGNVSAGVANPDSLAVGDLTGNGFEDIIVGSGSTGATSGGVAVFLNQLGTGFGSPIVTPVMPGTALQSVLVANVNQDAFPDLIVTTVPGTGGSTTDNIYTLLGNGDGTFERAVPYIAGGTSSPTVAPSSSALISDPFLRVTTFHSGGTTVEPNLIDNGTFSTTDLVGVKGSLTGWQQYELPDNPGGSHGDWSLQTGTTSPLSGTSVAPPSGAFQAMLDEANITPYSGANNPNPASSYAGSTALYQDFTIPTGAVSVSLSMTLDLYNFSDDTSTTNPQGWGDNTTNGPQILNYNTSTLNGAFNQQVRVDLMDSSNIDSITGVNNTGGLGITPASGLLANIFMTTAGDDFTNPVTITVSPNGVIKVNGVAQATTINWSLYAGKTIMLRIATTNNAGQLIVGVQNVQVDALFTDTTPPVISDLALRNPGDVSGSQGDTTDPTITGVLSDIGGLNTPAGFKQGNVAYIEFDLSNDSFSGAAGDVVDKITNWDSAGNFTFTIPNPVPNQLITVDVAAVDEAGNVSAITPFTFFYQGPSLTNWQAFGPTAISVVGQPGINYTTVSGDVTAVATDPTDPTGNTYYVGSDNGGVWKTTDGGNDYTPLTDNVTNSNGQPIPVPVGAIAVSKAVDPATNTHVVYVGTGVANLNPNSMGGFGVLVSLDGGTTWAVDGNSGTVLAGATISSIVVDNDNPNIVWVAVASGGVDGAGVYWTNNALGNSSTTVNTATATWTYLTPGTNMSLPNGSTLGAVKMESVTSLIEDPFEDGRLIMGVGNIGMSPGSDSVTEGVWLSINNGASWTLQVGGQPSQTGAAIPNSSLPNGSDSIFGQLGRVTVAMGTGRVGDEANVYVLIGTPPTSTTAPNFDYGSEYGGTNGSGLYYSPNNMNDFTDVMLKVNTPAAVVGYHNFQSINLLGNNASNAGALIVDPTDPDVVYVGGSTEGITNPSNIDQSFIRVDVGNIDGINGTNTGDDASKLARAQAQDDFYNFNPATGTGTDPYVGEGVYWYNIAGATSGNSGKVQLLPPDITSLTFDAQGRLIIGTDEGVWRGVSEGFGYDFTSGGQGILVKHGGGGGGGGQQFSTPGMALTAINGNLQIADLTSVAIDPSLRGVLYTTQYVTGTAASSAVLDWTSQDLTGPTVNGTDLGIHSAGDVLISTPPVGAPADTPNTLYRVWEFAATGALVPEVSSDGGATWTSLASTGIPTSGLTAGDFPAFVIDPQQILAAGIYESVLLLGVSSSSTGKGEVFITKTSSNVWDALPPVPISGGTISALAISPSDDEVIYVGTSTGQVFTTTNDGGDGWPLVDTGLPTNTPVTSITVDPNNPQIAYVTFGGSGSEDRVYMTQNSGASWTDISSNLPAVAANSLIIVPVTVNGVTTDDLYVATDVGVYMTTNMGGSWSRVGVGMPNVPVVSLQYNANFGVIAAATQGRGVFTLSTNVDGPYVTALANGSSSTTINTIDVTFDEPINTSTFTPSVITLTGPNGAVIPVTGVTDIDSGQDEEFALTFAPQSASGLYTVTFGPNVKDQVGNLMDQNQNGINGENPGDIFSGQVYFFTGSPAAPVLGNTNATFPAAGEDNLGTNTGTAVLSNWVTTTLNITESNPSLTGQGIAITGVNDSNGTWEYSLNAGATWTAIPTGAAANAVSEQNALLLEASANDELRFVPSSAFDSQTVPTSGVLGSSTFTYRAWNLTSGLSPIGDDGTFADVSTADGDNGGTTAFSSAEGVATVDVTYVNHAPTFIGGANQTVLENAAAQSVAGWATNLSAGPPNESGQTLSFAVTNNDNSLFSVQPAVSSTGTLTYTLAPNANGTATVTVFLQDNGGTANGGQNTSQPYLFTITATPVNQAPTFTGGPSQAETVFGGVVTVANWATNISTGPGNPAGETASFVVTNSNPALFSVQPTISSNGTLTYQVGSTIGTATVTVVLQNNGGTANGGKNTSVPYTFTITANPVVSSGSADDAWVSQVYRQLLGHEITASEVSFWNTQFNAGATRLQVATEIANSAEYDTVFLTGLYQKYLGRTLDAAGQSFFVSELQSGMTPNQVQAQILSSTEYYNRNGGTTFGYLFALYRDVLGQSMPTAGYNYWNAQIAAGMPLSTVATEFLTSAAGESALVQNVYSLMLGHSASSAAISYWSTMPQNTMEAQIAATGEYGLDSTAQYYNSQPDVAWLNQVYLHALNRPLDGNGQSYFIDQIREGVSYPGVANIITTSQEFYTNLVTTEFTNILRRVPDSATVSYFVGLLQQGETVEQVEAVMYGSAEFFNNEGGGTDDGFLSALYLDALDRPLDSTGEAVWGAELLAFPSTYNVALSILTSSEAQQDLIGAAYLKYLGHSVDSAGNAYWLGQLQAGMTDQEFYAQLLGSLEFYNKYS